MPAIEDKAVAETAALDDDEFLHSLCTYAGDTEAWARFDRSAWLSVEVEAAEEEADQENGQASNNEDDGGHEGETSLALNNVVWPETGLAMGDLSADGDIFVSWDLVEGYPTMFVGKKNSRRAAPFFTLDGIHEDRVWDLYYLHHPEKLGDPAIFVPTYQFEDLLHAINAKLETELTIPPGPNHGDFKMSFGLGNSPRPRFLGRSNSAECFKSLCAAIPAPKPEDDVGNATELGKKEFMSHLYVVQNAKKRKLHQPSKSDNKRRKRVTLHKTWGKSVKRVQRYLGLRKKLSPESTVADGVRPTIDFHSPMVHEPENSVLFVAIDTEAWEKDHSVLTEVGIAMLDTNDIRSVAPGDGGKNWFPLIRARHIRIEENRWAMNGQFVPSCAKSFNFGTSEWAKVATIPSILQQLIDKATLVDPADGTVKPRHVVLVFHERSADIKYLQSSVKYNITDAMNVLDVVDTKEMHQYATQDLNGRALETVLKYLDIHYENLHNGGNDAVYTLRAMIGLAVDKRLKSIAKAEKARNEPMDHIPFAEFMAKEREKEGWSSGGEETDGGDALGLFDLANNGSQG